MYRFNTFFYIAETFFLLIDLNFVSSLFDILMLLNDTASYVNVYIIGNCIISFGGNYKKTKCQFDKHCVIKWFQTCQRCQSFPLMYHNDSFSTSVGFQRCIWYCTLRHNISVTLVNVAMLHSKILEIWRWFYNTLFFYMFEYFYMIL